jgi:hypothetical protein
MGDVNYNWRVRFHGPLRPFFFLSFQGREMVERILAVVVAWSLGVGAVSAAEPVDFAAQIEPILVERCAKCHGEAKAQAKLRLDSVAALQERIGAKPQLVVAGKPDESVLYQRLVLPTDNPKRMPKGGDPLPKEQIELIAEWIKQGAKFGATTAAATVAATPATSEANKAQEKTQESKPVPLPEVAPAPPAAIEKLTATGARVAPLFAGSNLLEVSFAGSGKPATDADVASLAEVAEQIYSLNLADAALTSAGFAPLAAMKNLSMLHLERAAIDDDALTHLSGLANLQYLNLYGTEITDSGLKHISGLGRLNRLYLWQTKVSYDAAMGLEKSIPGLQVNLGYDHPVVARKRLSKELDDAKKELEKAKAGLTKLEEELTRTKQDVEARTSRIGEIEKEIQGLAAPGGS